MGLCIMGYLSWDLPSVQFNIIAPSSFQSLSLWKLSLYFYRIFIGSWEGKQGPSCYRPPPHIPGAHVQWQLGSSLLQNTSTLRELQQAKTRSWALPWDKQAIWVFFLPPVPSTGRPKTECRRKRIPSKILKSASALVPAIQDQIFLTVSGWVIPLRAAVWIKWAIFDPSKSGFVLISTEEHFLSCLE